jgi:hypothetical protein
MGENLKVVLAEFSTLTLAVSAVSAIAWCGQAWQHLELKIVLLACLFVSSTNIRNGTGWWNEGKMNLCRLHFSRKHLEREFTE